MKDCHVLPSYVHANIGETSCMLSIRPDLVNISKAVNQEDYNTFFEYRMDQYTKSGKVGRETTNATAEFGEKILSMVVDNLAPMIQAALREEIPKSNQLIHKDHLLQICCHAIYAPIRNLCFIGLSILNSCCFRPFSILQLFSISYQPYIIIACLHNHGMEKRSIKGGIKANHQS